MRFKCGFDRHRAPFACLVVALREPECEFSVVGLQDAGKHPLRWLGKLFVYACFDTPHTDARLSRSVSFFVSGMPFVLIVMLFMPRCNSVKIIT